LSDKSDYESESKSPQAMPFEDFSQAMIQKDHKSSIDMPEKDLKHQNNGSGLNCHNEENSDKTIDTDDENEELKHPIDLDTLQASIFDSNLTNLLQGNDEKKRE